MLRVRFHLPKVLALGDVRTRSDLMMALAPVVGVIDHAIQRNFDEQGRPEPWEPLSEEYALAKALDFPGKGILERTGLMRRTIKVRVEPRPISGLAEIVASSDVPYAPFHHFGSHKTHLPRRRFLVLTEEDVQETGKALSKGLREWD